MRRPLCCVCVAFVAAVAIYLKVVPLPEAAYGAADKSPVTLSGKVSQKEYKDNVLILTLGDIQGQDEQPQGVLCYIEPDEGMVEPKLGSTVTVQGKISYLDGARDPGGFDARTYYRIQGVDYRIYSAEIIARDDACSVYRESLYRVRRYLERILDEELPEKDASIMKAMLLGNKSGLDAQSRQLFQRSGIAHILAISGLHITLLGMGLYKILRRSGLAQPFCAVVSIAVMTAYGDMTGMSSSAYRAILMFGMQLAAKSLKRTYDMLTALAVAAVLVLVEQPLYLYHSGFLLSFGAVLGLACMSEVMWPMCHRKKKRFLDKMASSLCASQSIFLIHFPIMLCVYHEFPVYSFVLNLIVIPAMTVVMAAGLLCLGFGSLPTVFAAGAAKLAGGACHLLLSAFEKMCMVSQGLPFADWIVGRPKDWKICVFAAAVLYLYAAHHYGGYLSRKADRGDGGAVIGLTVPIKQITVLAAVLLISSREIDGASLTFLDVGQGDCIWIESAGGEHFLIDGGSTTESKVGEHTIVPYLKYNGVSRLDAVFLTHLDSDHISGVMEMLGDSGGIGTGIRIDRICISDAVLEDEAYDELMELCRLDGIPVIRLKSGDRIAAQGMLLEVLHPSGDYVAASRNASSLVMKLTVRDRSGRDVTALFTGDVEADGEQAAARVLAAGGSGRVDIYKAAHHGSGYSNTEALVMLAAPQLVVISCAEGNRYGHPHDVALQHFADAGSTVRITKDTGAIMIKIKRGEIYETHHTGYQERTVWQSVSALR